MFEQAEKVPKGPTETAGVSRDQQRPSPFRPNLMGRNADPGSVLQGKFAKPREYLAASTVIQRKPIDASGKALTLDPVAAGLDPLQTAQYNAMVADGANSTVFKDANDLLLSLKGTTVASKNLPGIDSTIFGTKLAKAKLEADRRQELAPMKLRTNKGGVIVNDDDPTKPGPQNAAKAFNDLDPHMLPTFPEGTYTYWSHKREKYKHRSSPGATQDWKLTLYQNPDKSKQDKVGYNMLHGNRLARTLFPYNQGRTTLKRDMAGLEAKDADKWSDSKAIVSTGKSRKLNKFAHKAIVQGHGVDYEHTMSLVGDYNPTHSTASDLTPVDALKRKRDSDHHPSNFSGEHPVYGQNFRNKVLNDAIKTDKRGYLLEDTTYLGDEVKKYRKLNADFAMPEGFASVKPPSHKSISILDSGGKPSVRYEVPQMIDTGKGFGFVDYATQTENYLKSIGINKTPEKMEELMDATKALVPEKDNPSYVDKNVKTGINDPSVKLLDAPNVQANLPFQSNFWMHLKPKDFV